MAEDKFQIGVKAEKLYYDVFDITTNRNHYPVKFRRLSDKLQEYALNIYCNSIDANTTPANNERNKCVRFNLKTSVISDCVKLQSLTQYSLHKNLISAATSERWVGLISEIRRMTFSWRKSD